MHVSGSVAQLGHQLHGSARLLDLLLGQLGEELGADQHGLLGQRTLAQHL